MQAICGGGRQQSFGPVVSVAHQFIIAWSRRYTIYVLRPLRRVGVLGAGTMGSRIAAHFANAGFPVELLDIVIPGQPNRNAAALAGLQNAAKQKPVAFYSDSVSKLIRPGNFDDDLGR